MVTQQDSIPVECVPTAEVASIPGRVDYRGGSSLYPTPLDTLTQLDTYPQIPYPGYPTSIPYHHPNFPYPTPPDTLPWIPYPGYPTLDTLPLDTLPWISYPLDTLPLEGTWDQRYPPPERTWYQGYPSLLWADKHP